MPEFERIEPKFTESDAVDTAQEPEVQEAQFAEPQIAPLRSRINKKRAVMLFLFIAIMIGATVFLLFPNKPTPTLPAHTQQPITFIDDNESQNKLLKENAEAKQANVNIFDFDINNCLQQYDEEKCTDMYEKHLLITEKK